jgi:hypothetical protein
LRSSKQPLVNWGRSFANLFAKHRRGWKFKLQFSDTGSLYTECSVICQMINITESVWRRSNFFVATVYFAKYSPFLTFLGTFAKLQKVTISFVMSVCPHVTARLPLDRFSWNFIFENFSKNCQKKSSFIKIRQE